VGGGGSGRGARVAGSLTLPMKSWMADSMSALLMSWAAVVAPRARAETPREMRVLFIMALGATSTREAVRSHSTRVQRPWKWPMNGLLVHRGAQSHLTPALRPLRPLFLTPAESDLPRPSRGFLGGINGLSTSMLHLKRSGSHGDRERHSVASEKLVRGSPTVTPPRRPALAESSFRSLSKHLLR